MDFLNIGRVVNTHGVKGAVKVIPTTDDPTRFEQLDYVYIENRGKTSKYTIGDKIKYFKNMLIIKFDEVNNMDEAELLKQSIIKIPRELALPLEEDEYYITDLIGLDVNTTDNNKLGVLKDVIFTGSNEVYVVKTEIGKEVLIPAIKQCVKNIDLDHNVMTVELMEGLID